MCFVGVVGVCFAYWGLVWVWLVLKVIGCVCCFGVGIVLVFTYDTLGLWNIVFSRLCG